jgi:hypothetical protein
MPKKNTRSEAVPTLVQERLRAWGACIKKQRITQNIQAKDLCLRTGISDATLRRLEKGDSGAGVGIFLATLMVLGVLDDAAPMLKNTLWEPGSRSRVRPPAQEGADDDF